MDKEFLRLIENVEELIPESTEKLGDDVLICECFCVSVKDIKDLCADKVDLELLQSHFNLGQGCQSCMKSFDSWSKKIF